MTQEFFITLNIPPALEGMIVDNLLTLEFERGFSGFTVFAHHHENKGLSLAEQVTGRQKRIQFQMYVDGTNLALLLANLRENFSGSGIQYWVTPVLENGVI
jgi:hypothetical protein